MSINVNISGNPITVRRGKVGYSDLEKIKKSEKERLKKLRLEQVQEQSKAISKRLLERARKAEREELKRLGKDGNSELRKAQEKKLLDIHKRYQDVENIGYAHDNASRQLDAETLKIAQEKKNQDIARQRAAEAAEKLKQKVQSDPQAERLERLNRVRQNENTRSFLVAQLGKKTQIPNNKPTPSKKKTHLVKRPSPVKKKLSKSINVSINNREIDSKVFETTAEVSKDAEESQNFMSEVANLTKTTDYKPRDYQESICTTTTISNSTSSISEDSSYFSDNSKSNGEIKSSIPQKVDLYDHNNRHRNTYHRPAGLVERIVAKDMPDAKILAADTIELEKKEAELMKLRRQEAARKSEDAKLRNKVRRDYEALVKKLNELAQEENKVKASQCANLIDEDLEFPLVQARNREKKQQNLDNDFRSILRTTQRSPSPETPVERVITLPSNDVQSTAAQTAFWRPAGPIEQQISEESVANDCTDEEIVTMLLKVEKMKSELLKKYGSKLSEHSPEVQVSKDQSPKKCSIRFAPCNDKEIQVELTAPCYPLEPEVKIITAENNSDSTGSSSSNSNDVIVNIQKSPPKKVNIDSSPVNIQIKKGHVMIFEESRDASPTRRSQSLPDSKVSSPNKTESRSRSCERLAEPDTDKIYRNCGIQVTIDSSVPNSSSDAVLELVERLKGKRIPKLAKDSSDASTTYASPPSPVGGTINLKTLNSSTPIFEMLDSARNKSYPRKRAGVSPVSSPETPSPRTMGLPSNKPKGKINKALKFSTKEVRISKSPSKNKCSCKNPNCERRSYQSGDAEIKEKRKFIEKLKECQVRESVCLKNIQQYNTLLRQIRGECQQTTIDSPATAESANAMILKDKIDGVYNKFKQLLENTKMMIANNQNVFAKPVPYSEIEKSPTLSDLSKDTSSNSTQNDVDPNKPKIISNERVNLDLDRFKLHLGKNIGTEKSSEVTIISELNESLSEIKNLTQEILEQSKHFNKSLPANHNLSDRSFFKSSEDALKIREDSLEQDLPPVNILKSNNEQDFIPLLAGIPKLSCSLANGASLNMRRRPPCALGTYGLEITLPGHELSTIAEFDTPDTASKNRSIKNIKNRISEISIEATPKSSKPKDLRKIALGDKELRVDGYSSDSLHSLMDVRADQLLNQTESQFIENEHFPANNEVSDFPTLQDENVDTSNVHNEQSSEDSTVKNLKLTSSSSILCSGLSGVTEIMTTPSSVDLNPGKCLSSPEEMELTLKKLGINWAIPTLKKTREASALSSSSNSDVTLGKAAKKLSQIRNSAFCELSDVSSISIRYENKSTDKSLLHRKRTSTPMKQIRSNADDPFSSPSKSSIDLHENSKVQTTNLSALQNKRSVSKV